MISASHNPIEWNALKFIGPTGLFLEAAEGAAMRALVEPGIPRATWDKLGDDRRRTTGAVERHIDRVLAIPYLDVEAIRARKFHVALDCVRGAGATIMPALLERLGCDGHGDQPRDRTAAFRARRSRSPRTSASWNGSCRRAAPTSASRSIRTSTGWRSSPMTGKAIGEDYTLALAARLVLRHRKGPVVTNLSTSRIVEDVARARRAWRSIRAPVGEVNVAVRMRERERADRRRRERRRDPARGALGRDAPVGAALLLQLLRRGGPAAVGRSWRRCRGT